MKRCPACSRIERDDALAFCRADGTALVTDSSALSGEVGTAKLGSAATEIETSILPHATDAGMNRSTAATTMLPVQTAPSTTGKLTKPGYQRKVLIAVAALVIVAVVIGGYLYVSRRNSTAIGSIAVMPFVNASGNPDVEYLSDGITESLINSLCSFPIFR